VIDARSTSSTVDSGAKRHSYSETDAFSLRYRSMYLALALKQFVLNVTDYLKTQWTWKKCLKFAIEAMNDVGVEYYSNFETQRLWHRKFARNRYFYCKTQEPKTSYPAFFVENPDAMEAFKKYGIAHIKDL
jgi:alpha-amylase/alpha-mannosidase (GH57 family)